VRTEWGLGYVSIFYTYSTSFIKSQYSNLLDATRIEDGSYVGLKKINKTRHPYEAELAVFVSSEPLSSDPTNHCIPVCEVLQVPDDDNFVILIMPFLRPFDDPPFDTFGETIECYRQILEVLYFTNDILLWL
jgi:hypothetical protein